MNLPSLSKALAKAGYLLGSFTGGFKAASDHRWEGAEQSRFRNRPGRALESVDWGVNYGVREGMLSEARNLEQTYAVARRINRQYSKHVVGSCRMKWATGNPDIDKIYSDAWQVWMKICDLRGRHNFRKLSKIATARVLVDGRTFGQLDRRNVPGIGSMLMINPVEGDRASSDGIFNADRRDLVSGIGLDDNGRATFVKIWKRTLYGTFESPQEIPIKQLVHVFDTDRFDSVSGVTHYAAVLNSVRDLKETIISERLSAKKNSKISLIIKSILGGAASPVNIWSDSTENPVAGAPTSNVEKIGDVANLYTLPAESIEALESNRPSQGWIALMEWMVREISLGLDLPFGLVWSMTGLGGPAVRFEIMQAIRTFIAFLEDVLEPMWVRPIVGAWITIEMAEGRLPFHPNWYQFSVPRPKSLTIDYGRDSKASIAENLAGLGTATDWFAEDDEEFEAQTDRLVYEARYRECARRGIPFDPKIEVPLEQIRLIVPNGNPNQADPALAGEDDEDSNKDGGNETENEDDNEKEPATVAR